MTKLPATIAEAEMIDTVSQWVEQIEERMTVRATRAWLQGTLREYLLRDLIEQMKVIEAADAGDEIADAALGYVFHSMMDRHEKPPASLIAYEARARLRGPSKRGQGRSPYDNWARDIGFACLIFKIVVEFAVRPTRNPAQRRRNEPSACSLAYEALGRRARVNAARGRPERQFNISEKRLENIWGGLIGQIVVWAVQNGFPIADSPAKSESPSNTPI